MAAYEIRLGDAALSVQLDSRLAAGIEFRRGGLFGQQTARDNTLDKFVGSSSGSRSPCALSIVASR